MGINFLPNKSNQYSRNECRVGTWINGKPLYRKTFDFTNLNTGDNLIPISDLNLDTLVSITRRS